jgi:hypothetical protein
MKKYILLGFSMVFVLLFAVSFDAATIDGIQFPAYKVKVKPPKEQRIQAQIEIRNSMLKNVETGLVDPNDWYEALEKVTNFYNRVSARAGNIEWKEGGPLDVGGRSRGFVFDNQTPNKCYTSAVSGGIFESFDRGNTWRPVPGFDKLPILSIGCMIQSINGDVYAGTGEYWGNDANGQFGSQFNGNGIYRKKANSDNWELLGFENPKSGTTAPQFSLVIDMGCDPVDNNKVFAATSKGLFVSRNGGDTWTKVSGVMSTGVISQIKPSSDPNIWYAGRDGITYKSTDGGTTWAQITTGNFIANHSTRKHIRIAVSKQDPKKVYVCGIDTEAKLRFAIRSVDGGSNWQFLGKQDALLQPLCSSDGTACQGWFDLCLAINPSNDDHLFLGGQQAMYTWSPATNWVKAAFWNSPAKLGQNLIHADMHEFAFDEKRPDTLAICTDGGVYITYNAKSQFPNPTWVPKNKAFNVTQFYDMNASIYGEMLGGAQDNGTNLIRTDASSDRKSFEVSGGDGFNTAISAYNDSRVMFYTVYNGLIRKSDNMNANTSNPIIQGSCIDVEPRTQAGLPQGNGEADGIGFHTRIHIAEKLIPDPNNTIDSIDKEIPERSLFFVMHPSGFYVSPNASKPNEKADWTSVINPSVGEVIDMHQTKDLSTMYVVGRGGAKKITGFDKAVFNKTTLANNVPCLVSTTAGLGISISNVNGLPSNLGGVYVRQSSAIVKPEVLVTQMGFGGTQKVFYSNDGTNFVNKQGDLPIMPVYCGIIDELNEKHVLIGTEYGVWETDDITATSVKWVPSSKNVGMVPVFRIRQMKLRKNGCWMVYLGTHGRGTFYAPITEATGCSYNLDRPKSTSGIDPFTNFGSKFSVFPNPTSDVLNVRFKADKVQNYTITIYSRSGQFVKKMSYRSAYGINNVPPIEVNMLSKGTYFVRLEDDEKVVGGSQFIVQ